MEGGTTLQFLCVLMGNSLNTHRTCHAATTPKELPAIPPDISKDHIGGR